ncbi:2OG-Fe(II) oxygenase [Myxococcota bacterium]|nr:2OG-Fe(II) oxygenase [Myxococcota bacterium]
MSLQRLHHDELIYTVPDALTPEERALWIQHGERVGFDEATVTTDRGPLMRKALRNNSRVMLDAPEAAAALWTRLAPVAPPPWRDRPAIGLNERFRLYRYMPGERFLPHHDGAYNRPNGERSAWTLMVFLNDVAQGGETRFFRSRSQAPFVTITPRAGTALFFLHPILHEGAEVQQGVKYALRTDVMFAAP